MVLCNKSMQELQIQIIKRRTKNKKPHLRSVSSEETERKRRFFVLASFFLSYCETWSITQAIYLINIFLLSYYLINK